MTMFNCGHSAYCGVLPLHPGPTLVRILCFGFLSEHVNVILSLEGVYIFMEREIIGLSHVPFEEQIQTLVRYERVEEALGLLGGVQAHLPQVSYKVITDNKQDLLLTLNQIA